ncbi:MAG TPA: hypothetical protein VHK47_17790 [Polyangia bacterium]|jgi:hypothetical protein|nr:hypothetical protein [Polyangia bacterium]
MRRLLVGLLAVLTLILGASAANAKLAALYASGQGGLQNTGDTQWQAGFEVGARVTLVDAYVDYMGYGSGRSVSRGIVGLRGALGVGPLRFVLRGGAGAIREDNAALSTRTSDISLTRTGGVVRAGGAVEAKVAPLVWLGAGVDAEEFHFLSNNQNMARTGSDVLGTLKLTFELGI